MLSLFKRRRRGLLTSGALTGAVLASMAFAGTAGATTTPAANSLIIGSGSSTTYYMMQAMDTLFNDSQGCQIFAPNSVDQTLNFACESTTDGSPDNNSTSYVTPEELGNGVSGENPYNDVVVEEPYIGSSNGIKQLQYGGTVNPSNGFLPSAVNFARSSRAPKIGLSSGNDAVGENFVAYAKDGVDWVTFSEAPGIATTPSSCLAHDGSANTRDLELTQLQDIWNDGSSNISNWAELCADVDYYPATPTKAEYKDFAVYDAPICVYTAQDGSGTLATWDSYLSTVTTEDTINDLTPNTSASAWATSEGLKSTFVNQGCTDGTNGSDYGSTHQIFENETEQLIAQGATQTTKQYSDTADSIFFYSFGRFEEQCVKHDAICDPTGFKINLGEIGNQLPTEANIIATDCGPPGSGCFTGQAWAVPRYLYNVYGNGDTSAGIPAATAATVNYVSEVGFICKPQTETVNEDVDGTIEAEVVDIDDSVTGTWYRTAIDLAITSNGFFALPLQATEDSGTVDYPGIDLLPTYDGTADANDAYSVYDPLYDATMGTNANSNAEDNAAANASATNPSGYCIVFTTG